MSIETIIVEQVVNKIVRPEINQTVKQFGGLNSKKKGQILIGIGIASLIIGIYLVSTNKNMTGFQLVPSCI